MANVYFCDNEYSTGVPVVLIHQCSNKHGVLIDFDCTC